MTTDIQLWNLAQGMLWDILNSVTQEVQGEADWSFGFPP